MKKRPFLQVLSDLFPGMTRDALYSRILCGEVLVNHERVRDPKLMISPDSKIEFVGKRYVSRGGEKLEYALSCTDFAVTGKVVLDAGSSTGGFTDCLLQHGARHIHAVDVGTNQLAYSLRVDSRVSVYERTNIMTAGPFLPVPDVAVADISFRSLRNAAARILNLTTEKRALLLAKPQFEWQGDDKAFDGVLRKSSEIRTVLFSLAKDLAREHVYIHAIIPSPITGRKGNREFFLSVSPKEGYGIDGLSDLIELAVNASERIS